MIRITYQTMDKSKDSKIFFTIEYVERTNNHWALKWNEMQKKKK